ncbi:hypothetical protein Glove_856g4 [Diversispora epigaea]|uniref:PPPDE domain-containing protein n=1 Tax=Diversispora epigaea TaxID=1348612 RepID=A0A397FYZ3_9GLOM|nr:hypothetical protein Glove_856g4 [Diversispora epigaea]
MGISSSSSSSSPSSPSSLSSLSKIKFQISSSKAESWYTVIKRKLKEDDKILEKLDIETEDQLDELIISLGEEHIFLEKYLKLNPEYNDHHVREINRNINQIEDDIACGVELDAREYENTINNLLEKRRKSDKFNVYFFITKLNNGISDSPVGRKISKNITTYGAFHVGIEVDGITLEWGSGNAGPSLIYPNIDPRKMIAYLRINYESSMTSTINTRIKSIILAAILLDYKKIGSELLSAIKDTYKMMLNFAIMIGIIPSNKLKIIAEKCVYWNRNNYYNSVRRNCQTFVIQLLNALDLEFKPQGEFQKFLNRIINDADDRFIFKNIEFKSRSELDNYVDQYWDSIKNEEIWDKKLLLCYSDMMQTKYIQDNTPIWGPMNHSKWNRREFELRSS